MENYELTDVYGFLQNQYEYLVGDLKIFHKICREVEIEQDNFNCCSSQITSSASQPIPISSTLTTETTSNPGENLKLYRLTIPITLSLFATIDSVGFLSGKNSNPNNTEQNFREFFKQSAIIVTPKDVELINYIFRQGLSHIYFPKLNLGISYHSENPNDKIIFKSINGYLTLNVNVLEKIVIKTFETIKEKSELYHEMETKYKNLIDKYTQQDGEKISNYD